MADHAIIASGVGGLVAASRLALAGVRLTALRRKVSLGGCLRTADLRAGSQHAGMAATRVVFMTLAARAALGSQRTRHKDLSCHRPHPTAVLRPHGEAVALIHLADGAESVCKVSNEAKRPRLPALPTICVGQPSRLVPARCPPGKAVPRLQSPDASRVITGDAAGRIRGCDRDTLRKAVADRIKRILAGHIRRFDRLVRARKTCPRAKLARISINLSGVRSGLIAARRLRA